MNSDIRSDLKILEWGYLLVGEGGSSPFRQLAERRGQGDEVHFNLERIIIF